MAEEDEFLFSYNVRRLNTKLAHALNRERGQRRPPGVHRPGEEHPVDVLRALGYVASRVLNATDDIVFVTPGELSAGGPMFDYARDDGKRLVVVPSKVAVKLAGLTDLDGNGVRTLDAYARNRAVVGAHLRNDAAQCRRWL